MLYRKKYIDDYFEKRAFELQKRFIISANWSLCKRRHIDSQFCCKKPTRDHSIPANLAKTTRNIGELGNNLDHVRA